MHGHYRVVAIAGEEGHFAGARVGHACDHRVGRVEHCGADVRPDVADDDALYDGKFVHGADV